jgi:hypothetical protein
VRGDLDVFEGDEGGGGDLDVAVDGDEDVGRLQVTVAAICKNGSTLQVTLQVTVITLPSSA